MITAGGGGFGTAGLGNWPKSAADETSRLTSAAPKTWVSSWRSTARGSHLPPDQAMVCQPRRMSPASRRREMAQ